MSRIKLEMTTFDAIVAMTDGNPGAVRVCAELLQQGDRIDPDAWLGGLSGLLALDTLGVYGSRVWMLYKDVCGQDLVKTLAVLRAYQLGLLDAATLCHAIDNYGDGVDCDAILAAVRGRLPNFSPTIVVAQEAPVAPMPVPHNVPALSREGAGEGENDGGV